MSAVNLAAEIREAQGCAQSLRQAAALCGEDRAALRTRLLLSAEALQAMTLLATRSIDRVELLEGALRECLHEMDRTSTTRAAISRARRALELP